MKKKMTTVNFQGTQNQEAKLAKVIDEYKKVKGALMPVLQKAQEIYGYLPIEVQKMIADGMEISLEEIYGVVTFYSQFLLNPKGETAISVCLGTACYVKGSGDILDKISENLGVKAGETSSDGKYSLEATRCIGACGLAPVMTVNEDVYGRIKLDDVESILAKYKK
ncbi:MAG: NAD(P)H-dependent oxidoreductase subunit E [Oscillospiraceae bacterium]|nr:NAD(P)H-dependent oxidoreductase subunit E [Oscillospiraceae bacterium]